MKCSPLCLKQQKSSEVCCNVSSSCVGDGLSGVMFPLILWAHLLPSRQGTYGILEIAPRRCETFRDGLAWVVAMVLAATIVSIAARITKAVIVDKRHG